MGFLFTASRPPRQACIHGPGRPMNSPWFGQQVAYRLLCFLFIPIYLCSASQLERPHNRSVCGIQIRALKSRGTGVRRLLRGHPDPHLPLQRFRQVLGPWRWRLAVAIGCADRRTPEHWRLAGPADVATLPPLWRLQEPATFACEPSAKTF